LGVKPDKTQAGLFCIKPKYFDRLLFLLYPSYGVFRANVAATVVSKPIGSLLSMLMSAGLER
jgi:hypothetical protein